MRQVRVGICEFANFQVASRLGPIDRGEAEVYYFAVVTVSLPLLFAKGYKPHGICF